MTFLAWHFVGDTLLDGSPIPPDGTWLEYKGKIQMCASGLHASREPFDALQYAPGDTLCLVECDNVAEEDDDKLVCRRRRIVARMDATELLRYFARMQAISVLDYWLECPPDSVLDYLMGDASQRSEAGRAAASAAWTAWAAASAASAAGVRREFNELVYECFEEWLK